MTFFQNRAVVLGSSSSEKHSIPLFCISKYPYMSQIRTRHLFHLPFLCVICFFVLNTRNISAQHQIQGKVLRQSDNSPISFANVYLKSKASIGTITNQEGYFRLNVPQDASGSLAISFIGFETKTISLAEVGSDVLTIVLSEGRNELSEVVIMPEDTLKKLIERAFNLIDKNYPSSGNLIKGFYRETNQRLSDQQFLYFSEALIDFYKPGYASKGYGPVRILEGGQVEAVARTGADVFFYAGPYFPQRIDFVKEREEFINPKKFNLYEYDLNGIVKYEDSDIYVVSFQPRAMAKFQGKFFIDRASLAFIGAEYSYSSHGLRMQNLLHPGEFRKRAFTVKYQFRDSTWSMFLVSHDGLYYNSRTNEEIRYTNEFVTTEITSVNRNPITETEAIPYVGIYSIQRSKFSDEFWLKPEVITRTSELEKTVNILFKRTDINLKTKKDTTVTPAPAAKKHKVTAYEVLRRLSSGVTIGNLPIRAESGQYAFSYYNYFSCSRNISKKGNSLFLGLDDQFQISPSFVAVIQFSLSTNSRTKLSALDLGIRWNKKLTGWKRPLKLRTGLSLSTVQYGLFIGENNPDEKFKVRKKIFDHKTQVYLGEKVNAFKPEVQLAYAIIPRLTIVMNVSKLVTIRREDKFFLEETAGPLFKRSSVSIPLRQTGVLLSRNEQNAESFVPHINQRRLIFQLGVNIGY
jgi:hypothetical protein